MRRPATRPSLTGASCRTACDTGRTPRKTTRGPDVTGPRSGAVAETTPRNDWRYSGRRRDVPGDDLAGARRGIAIYGPDPALGRAPRGIRRHPRRRNRRDGRRLRAPAMRATTSRPRVQRTPGRSNWTLRGGERYTELGGETQDCRFDPGLYINPGPWRIPHSHRGMIHYCKELGVPLEPFLQCNQNTFLHSAKAFGGKPRRFREVNADYSAAMSRNSSRRRPAAGRSMSTSAPMTRSDCSRGSRCSAPSTRPCAMCGGWNRATGGDSRSRRAEASAGYRSALSRRARGPPQPGVLARARLPRDARHADVAVPAGRRHGPRRRGVRQELGPIIRYNAK